jgi:hypothetical protein
MIEFNSYTPNPGAPTIFCNRIGGLYRLSPTITKLTFALTNGPASTVEVASLIWEASELDEAHRLLRWAFDEVRRGGLKVDRGIPAFRAN